MTRTWRKFSGAWTMEKFTMLARWDGCRICFHSQADVAIFRLPLVPLAFYAMIFAYTQPVQCLHPATVKRNRVKNIRNSFRPSSMEFQDQSMATHSVLFPSHLMVKPVEVQCSSAHF
jgi:hypothetical protein